MKAIKERAEEYAIISKMRGDMPLELAEDVYVEIATEQRAADIDEVCEWIIKEWTKHDCDASTAASRLRKAMGEQQ